MYLKIGDYINKPRDTKRERALARELRQLPEQVRYEFIEQILAQNNVILGLHLAKSVLNNKKYFERLLDHGLNHGDASNIRWWLECVTPKLGARRVIAILKDEMPGRPTPVWLALYWLPSLIDSNPSTQNAFEELSELAKTLKIKEGIHD